MGKEFWIRKLTSRKMWVSIAALVSALLVGFGAEAGSIEKVSAIIMAGATAISYILGEGFIDAERERNTPALDVLADDLSDPPAKSEKED